MHLSELCKAEYPLYVNYCLWLLAEIAVIAADIPEGMHVFQLINYKVSTNYYLTITKCSIFGNFKLYRFRNNHLNHKNFDLKQ